MMSLKNNNFGMFPNFELPLAGEIEGSKVVDNHLTSL